MDTLAHGLWGFILFFKHPYRWYAFIIAILPDVIPFIFHIFFDRYMYIQHTFDIVYSLTHSLFIAFIVVGLISLWYKKIILVLLMWPLHILIDIFTHPY